MLGWTAFKSTLQAARTAESERFKRHVVALKCSQASKDDDYQKLWDML